MTFMPDVAHVNAQEAADVGILHAEVARFV
jgi:hypothetical protein